MLIDPSRVRVRGPLAPFATGFAEELGRQGYTPLSARNQMWLMAQLSRWLLSEGIDAGDLSAADVDRFYVLVVPLVVGSFARSRRRARFSLTSTNSTLHVRHRRPNPPVLLKECWSATASI